MTYSQGNVRMRNNKRIKMDGRTSGYGEDFYKEDVHSTFLEGVSSVTDLDQSKIA